MCEYYFDSKNYLSVMCRGEEIVMPAEQTGLVKENYLWKVLLRRGSGPESAYLKVGNSGEFIDKDLAEHAWGPIVSALCRAYDKAPDRSLQRKVAQTFLRFVYSYATYNKSGPILATASYSTFSVARQSVLTITCAVTWIRS